MAREPSDYCEIFHTRFVTRFVISGVARPERGMINHARAAPLNIGFAWFVINLGE